MKETISYFQSMSVDVVQGREVVKGFQLSVFPVNRGLFSWVLSGLLSIEQAKRVMTIGPGCSMLG